MCLDIYWLLEKTKAKKPSCAGGNQSLASDKAFFSPFHVFNKNYQKRKRRKKRGGVGGGEQGRRGSRSAA